MKQHKVLPIANNTQDADADSIGVAPKHVGGEEINQQQEEQGEEDGGGYGSKIERLASPKLVRSKKLEEEIMSRRFVAYASFKPMVVDINDTIFAKSLGQVVNEHMWSRYNSICSRRWFIPYLFCVMTTMPIGLIYIWTEPSEYFPGFVPLWSISWFLYFINSVVVTGLCNIRLMKAALMRFETIYLILQTLMATGAFIYIASPTQVAGALSFMPVVPFLIFYDCSPRTKTYKAVGIIFYVSILCGFAGMVLMVRYKIISTSDDQIQILDEDLNIRTIYYSGMVTLMIFCVKNFTSFMWNPRKLINTKSWVMLSDDHTATIQRLHHYSHDVRKQFLNTQT